MENKEFNRQELAFEIIKILLANQGKYRRMTLINKLKYYLGMKDFKAEFDYNFDDIVKNAFIVADLILLANKK